jgi:hypothetical protein
MHERERGLFLFKNKVNRAMKELWMDLDYALGEETLKKAEAVNVHVHAGTVPGPIEWEDDICQECAFLHICLPDRTGDAMRIEDDEGLLALLTQREVLAANHKQYEEIDKELKTRFKEKDKLLIGSWFVTGKWQERKGYQVADSRFWTTKIIKA